MAVRPSTSRAEDSGSAMAAGGTVSDDFRPAAGATPGPVGSAPSAPAEPERRPRPSLPRRPERHPAALPGGLPAGEPPAPILSEETLLACRVMIVHAAVSSLNMLRGHLERAGFRDFVTTADATAALRLLRRERPDVLVLDVALPAGSGLAILHQWRGDPLLRATPLVALLAAPDGATKQHVLALGVTDYLTTPVDPHDLLLRVRNALITKYYQDQLMQQARRLEEAVLKRTAELAASREEVILCLARAGEFRDNETGNHVVRVGKYVGIIARQLGYKEEHVQVLEQAAQLHDVGKIGIPDEILHKPDKLAPDEFELMQKHCLFGRKIMERMPPHEWERLRKHAELGARMLHVPSSPVLSVAALIALTHHERWDGAGYPLGLAGEDIPIEGRMTAVADVFDALSTRRSYKSPVPRRECFDMMELERGKHFDPRVLDAFFRGRREIVQVQLECADMT